MITNQFVRLKKQKGKKLIEHYSECHFIHHQQPHPVPKVEKAKIKFESMRIIDFMNWFHRQHKEILVTMSEFIYHYMRNPAVCDISRICFDFKEIRASVHKSFGDIFTDYIQAKKDIKLLENIASNSIKCSMSSEKAKLLLSSANCRLNDIKQCKSVSDKICEILSSGIPAFVELSIVKMYNNDHLDPKNIDVAKNQYVDMMQRILYASFTKQLAMRWNANCIHKKQKTYKPSNDLTNCLLSDPSMYTGCENAMHIYEIAVGGDACEPNIESDLSSLNLRYHGRHTMKIETYYDENIIVTEMKDEQSNKTEKILKQSTIRWRATHSSPIVNKSKYRVSPSVDRILFPSKPVDFAIFIPPSMLPTGITIKKLTTIPTTSPPKIPTLSPTKHPTISPPKIPTISSSKKPTISPPTNPHKTQMNVTNSVDPDLQILKNNPPSNNPIVASLIASNVDVEITSPSMRNLQILEQQYWTQNPTHSQRQINYKEIASKMITVVHQLPEKSK